MVNPSWHDKLVTPIIWPNQPEMLCPTRNLRFWDWNNPIEKNIKPILK